MSAIPARAGAARPPQIVPAALDMRLRRLTTFERVIVANSAIIVIGTAAGWWITQHNLEPYHYLIDTTFIALAAVVCVLVNFLLLRAAFAPLHGVLATIRSIEEGDVEARAPADVADADARTLARAFNEMLDRLARAHREAAVRVLQAHEDERRRIALELHDETGQSLTALTLHAEVIHQLLSTMPGDAAGEARRQVERLGMLAQRTLVEVQALSRQLRPPLLDDLGLPAALRWLAEDARERLRLVVDVHLSGMANRKDRMNDNAPDDRALAAEDAAHRDAVETALFRVAQECLTNAARHGRARRVLIALRLSPECAWLTVVDDGAGFTPRHPHARPDARRGLGLDGMRERLRLLDGQMRIRSRPGRGCAIRATVPLAPSAPHDISISTGRAAYGPD
jgi:two-component system sensor histidine kinase UhpB